MTGIEIFWLKATSLMWQVVEKVLLTMNPIGRYLTTHPRAHKVADRAVALPEDLIKKIGFNCQMCGQCILHSTGLTCSMNCPKNIRNGPCGGVRANGHCEVKPEMRCVWVRAFERSAYTPWADHMLHINPPVDRQLQDTSSWINLMTGRDMVTPDGWTLIERSHDANHD